ncbi:M23 family metallopeptidase [Carboxydocella sp. JDF658]|uniref:M23 family metallopeptidase n=1 Tax=Carboxydocella sp. JDF658 TaxID=1926600 RepID=UPI0009AC5192|nr:M23 family metallopeptidase [Carboxydocella sp. JDF658]GAW30314.1 peptidase M23B [Carboxydocella sp. JDF658]
MRYKRNEQGWQEEIEEREKFYWARPEERYYRQQPGRRSSGIFTWSGGFGPQRPWYQRLLANRLLIQSILALLIFAVAIGVNDRQDPLSQGASAAIRYLLNTDTELEPVLGRIVKVVLSGEFNEWPTLTALTTKPEETKPAVSNQTFVLPLSGQISKKFGWVMEPNSDYPRFHQGIDILAPTGTEVKSVLAGTVTKTGEDRVYGKYVMIKHDEIWSSYYAHLDEIKVKMGDRVEAGQVIGTVGQSGVADTPHLHFELSEKGQVIDPLEKLGKDNI